MFGWDDARFFLALQRNKTLSAAGRKLGVDQATVGRRLIALEASLGVALFARTRDGYLPTKVAEALLPDVERAEEALLAAERHATGANVGLAGTLRITAPDLFGSHVVAPLLAEFHAAHPDIELELVASNDELNLTRREADLALRLVRPTQPLLVRKPLAVVTTTVYASEAYVAAHPKPVFPDGAGQALIGFDEGTFRSREEIQWLAQHARAAHVVLRCNRTQAMLAAASAGMGIALLPCYIADPVPGLVQLLPPKSGVHRTLWLVMHRDLRDAPRVRAFVDFFERALKSHTRELAGRRRSAR